MRRFWHWLTRRPVTLKVSPLFVITAAGRPVAGVVAVSWSIDQHHGTREVVFTVRTPIERDDVDKTTWRAK